MKPQIYLASRSPRRRELLSQIGVNHALLDVEIDETPLEGENAEESVLRLARAKARAGFESLNAGQRLPVLAADTLVAIGDVVLCKPAGKDEALAMLARLSGQTHLVFTGVALIADHFQYQRLSRSEVTFGEIGPAQACAYWASGEPADKAGAYAIQGLGAVFIRDLKGSYSGVMGLPLFETAELLRSAGAKLPPADG